MAEDRVKCLAAGCTEYLSKPIDRQKLLMTCSNYLRADIYPFKPADEQRQKIKSEIFNLKSQLELAGIEPPAKPEFEHSHESVEETMQSLRSNLANDPRCVLTTEDPTNPVVVEGEARLLKLRGNWALLQVNGPDFYLALAAWGA